MYVGEEMVGGGLKMWGLFYVFVYGWKSSKEIFFFSGSGNGRVGGGG